MKHRAKPAKKPKSKGPATRGSVTVTFVDIVGQTSRMRELKFGSVTMKGNPPDVDALNRNIKQGNTALRRATTKQLTPGVTLEIPAGVPSFRAAPDNPTIIIRILNGKSQRGRMRRGEFVAEE